MQGRYQFFPCVVLEHIAANAAVEGAPNELRVFVQAEHHHGNAKSPLDDLAADLDAISPRHPDVCHYDIRFQVEHGLQKSVSPPDGANHLEFRLQDRGNLGEHICVIVRQRNTPPPAPSGCAD